MNKTTYSKILFDVENGIEDQEYNFEQSGYALSATINRKNPMAYPDGEITIVGKNEIGEFGAAINLEVIVGENSESNALDEAIDDLIETVELKFLLQVLENLTSEDG